MKYIFFTLTFLLASGLIQAHIYSPNLWRDYNVTVCFSEAYENPIRLSKIDFKITDWEDSDKNKVRTWVKEDYSYEKTGIHFTGFKDCKDTPNPDVILFYTLDSSILNRLHRSVLAKFPKAPLRPLNPPGIGSLGVKKGLFGDTSTAEGYIVLGTSGMNKRTVIHEFGHVAGLSHEHIHPEAIKVEKNCYYLPSTEKIPEDSTIVDYDKSSVMNYCTFVEINMMKGLSPKDEQLLRSIYP